MNAEQLSWIMCAWSLITMWLMGSQRYKLAWHSSLASQFGWAWCAWQSNLSGMMAFSGVMVLVCLRALYRLRNHANSTERAQHRR